MALPPPPVDPRILAHDGPHSGPWYEAWSTDPLVLVPAALAVLLYARGLDRWGDRSRPHSVWRTLSFMLGVAIAVLAAESPLDELGERHFTFHMIQHEVLMMVAIPLVLLGAPTTPVLLGLPRAMRHRVVAPLAKSDATRAIYRVLTHPLVALLISTAIVFAWHFVPGWYEAALRNRALHDVQHLSFGFSAALVWWVVIDPRPLHARMSYPMRIGYLLAASTPKAFMAAFIAFAPEPLYAGWYARTEPVFALSLQQDQVLAGLMMWMPSQLLYLAAMAATFFVWSAASRQNDAREESGLPALEGASR